MHRFRDEVPQAPISEHHPIYQARHEVAQGAPAWRVGGTRVRVTRVRVAPSGRSAGWMIAALQQTIHA